MRDQFDLVWLILLLPLLGSIVQATTGKWIVSKLGTKRGRGLLGSLAVLFVAIPFALGVYLTFQISQLTPETRHMVVEWFDWISIAGLRVPFEVVLDPLTLTMVLVITGIGSLIHLYATGYMAEDRDYPRFFTYLNLFIAAMLILVLGNNLALLFVGWEGVGVCSYLLIGYWYKDLANAKAANKAFIVNRIGDWGMTLGIFMVITFLMTKVPVETFAGNRLLSYDVFIPAVVNPLKENPGIATAIALLFFVGAMGKSAQFPLYMWLPDAMAGPTPVSALIHAATMVTSGVVLLNRLHVLFELSPVAMAIVAIVGAFTALFAALIAFGQMDIKKVLAYSTVSQLGFMFMACGTGAFWVGMFHVTTHAFFKALLFLGSGAVIYAMSHEQDMRRYGNLTKYIKITAITMIIGWLAIAGVPGLSGFWSKEAILGYALGSHAAELGGLPISQIVGWTGLVVAVLTAAYMTRMTLLTFGIFSKEERWRALEPAHHDHHVHEHHAHHHAHEGDHADEHGFFYSDEEMAAIAAHEEHEHHHELDRKHEPKEVPPSMWVPLVLLAILSLGGGYVLHNGHLFQSWLEPVSGANMIKDRLNDHPHGIPLLWLSIGAAGIGILYGFWVYRKGLPKSEGNDESKWHPFRRSAKEQFGYDNAVVDAGVAGGGELAVATWKRFDQNIIDGILNGGAWLTGQIGRFIGNLQSGFARGYALQMLIGSVALLGFLMWLAMKSGGAV